MYLSKWRRKSPVRINVKECCARATELRPLHPGFVFNVVQLQEDVQSIAEALFIGSGNKARANTEFLFDHQTQLLLTGLS